MIQQLSASDFPYTLKHIPDPPQQLFIRTCHEDNFASLMQRKRVAIVGARKATNYGQGVTSRLAGELASSDVVVISGLALGTDALAHQAALEAGGLTMAVLPTPVENIQPRTNVNLAKQILDNYGVLISEYPAGSPIYKPNFVARNRIVSGLADALLITEAAENSGTLRTAEFAMDQGVTVMVVPGNITSPYSAGTNNLLRTGATPVTRVQDVFHALGIRDKGGTPGSAERNKGRNPGEQQIIDLLGKGISSGSQLLTASGMSVPEFNSHLTMLEITAKVRPLGANNWTLA